MARKRNKNDSVTLCYLLLIISFVHLTVCSIKFLLSLCFEAIFSIFNVSILFQRNFYSFFLIAFKILFFFLIYETITNDTSYDSLVYRIQCHHICPENNSVFNLTLELNTRTISNSKFCKALFMFHHRYCSIM